MAACRRSCSLEVDSFALTFKFSEAPQALRANFFARTGRFCARLARSKGPRTRFWKPKRLDFRSFSRYTAARCKIALTGGRHAKTVVFAAPDACEFAANAFLPRCGDKVVLRVRFGASWERPGPSTWRPTRPTWRPRRPTWRPRQPNLASSGRSERVPARSRRNPERPKAARSAPEQHLVEFSSILGSLGPPGTSIFGFSGALFERCCDQWCFAFGISKKSCATQPGILACALCGRFVLRARLSKSPCSIFFRCEHASPPSF